MPETEERSCPDCGGVMHGIKILDRGGRYNFASETDVIEYAVPEARRSFWTGRFPVEGRVGGVHVPGLRQDRPLRRAQQGPVSRSAEGDTR
jgi:hypothetical protein